MIGNTDLSELNSSSAPKSASFWCCWSRTRTLCLIQKCSVYFGFLAQLFLTYIFMAERASPWGATLCSSVCGPVLPKPAVFGLLSSSSNSSRLNCRHVFNFLFKISFTTTLASPLNILSEHCHRVSSYRMAQKYRIIGHFFPKYRTFFPKYRTKMIK